MNPSEEPATYRPGTKGDGYATFLIFERAYSDLLRRQGSSGSTSVDNPDKLARMWSEREPLYTHLAETADQFWIAEREGQPIGYSRSIVRGNLRELTELFVLPGRQSGGVGRELIQRAFPADQSEYRVIIATTDIRAQVLYLKAGVYPRFTMNYFGKEPEKRTESGSISGRPMQEVIDALKIVGGLDKEIIGHQRDADHNWLMRERKGYLYYDGNQLIGYGYLGVRNGPFALLDAEAYPAVLSHAENHAYEICRDHFGVEVPLINQPAVDYLLEMGFKIDTFMAVMMTNRPFGRFENYVATSPPFFM